MDKDQFVRDCIEWDVVNWSKALGFWEGQVELSKDKLNCLELGGRSGGLSMWLSNKGHSVICSDLDNPKDKAETIHKAFNLDGTITYEAIDATNIPYENHFDVIIFKSILGGIGRNGKVELIKKVIDETNKALKPGGKLLFAENLRSSYFHQLFRKKLVRWGGAWNYLKVEEVNNLFKSFDHLEFRSCGFLGAFGGTESQKRFLGKIDSFIFDKLLSDDLKYIIYGVATKAL